MSRASVPRIGTAPLAAQIDLLAGLVRLRELVPSFAEASAETVDAVLEAAAAQAADRLEALNATSECAPPRVVDGEVVTSALYRQVWQDFAQGGWMTLDMPSEHGGQGLPLVVAVAAQEVFDRHCCAFGMLPVPIRSAARLIDAWASDAIKAEWLPKLMSGEWGATICISEVGAGSDAGRMRTLAKPQDDGTWSITGEKQWISFGDHDLTGRIGHCLLARTEGSRGLSLFLVPDRIDGERNGVFVRNLEHKLGLHLSPTCAMGFEGARGWMLGEEGRGLAQMFVMIANMRMAVGGMGLGMASGAADVALSYARERLQGGRGPNPVPIIEHADVQRMVLGAQAEVEAGRAVIYAAAVEADLARVESDPARRAESAAIAQWLLPIVKTLGGELAFNTASTAIQVLGGAGYTVDWPTEQILRDARVLTIFEGTSGMQALDLLHRRLWKDRRAGLDAFLRQGEADAAALAAAGQDHLAAEARTVFSLLDETAAHLMALEDQPREAEAGASALLDLSICAAQAWGAARIAAAGGAGPVLDRLRALGGFLLGDLAGRAKLHAGRARRGADHLAAISALG
ncbi:acyl-CoA dehydrogenase family protein [Novosphingobium sp.]|uniref:acyl-CoA dehydrogenase family protein n=1 Tax=Novosphingobium sp. TaxID=1874826 RepID=UPI001D4ECEFD|nr:acyl-CoA dehydrogenase family protein [Novosphingobium sp.]MBX9662641.1 acyl-CoA dehydrogenase family protein [Novosphingobium sp.]